MFGLAWFCGLFLKNLRCSGLWKTSLATEFFVIFRSEAQGSKMKGRSSGREVVRAL